MSVRETKVPAIPDVRDDNVLDVLRAVKNVLEVREGNRGDALDQNVTLRDLTDLSILKTGSTTLTSGTRVPVVSVTVNDDGYDPTTDMTAPPAPTGLTATGGFTNVYLYWDGAQYKNHSYTEIWRATTNNLGSAVRVGTTISSVYSDPAAPDTTYYYWVRFVSQANMTGAYNSTTGTSASTAIDVSSAYDEIFNNTVANGTYASSVPFIFLSSPLTVNGVTYPAGTWIKDSFIGNATISSAKIKDLVADKITTGNLTAGIGITTGYISSGITPGMYPPGHPSFGTGYYLGPYGGVQQLYIGSYANNMIWNGTELSIKGTVSASGAVFKGVTIQDSSGNVMLASGNINGSYVTGLSTSNISGLGALATQNNVFIGSTVRFADGTVMNTGDFVNSLSKINSTNISTFIAAGAIGNAYIGNAAISSAKIQDAAITSAKIENAAITNAKIGTAEVDTLKLAGDSVTIHDSITTNAFGNPNSYSFNVSMAYAGTITVLVFATVVNATYSTSSTADWYLYANGSLFDSDTGGGGASAIRAQLRAVFNVPYGGSWGFQVTNSTTGMTSVGSGIGATYRILILKRYR